jgi:hypothetical protein
MASMPSLERRWSTTSSSSSSDSSDSDSSASEAEAPRPAASRLARRLQSQQQESHQQQPQSTLERPQQSQQPPHLQLQQQAAVNNIVARSAAAAPATPAAATVVRVCQGKKCSQQGAGALLQTFAAMPGVVAQPVKCLKQCKRCPAVEMAAAFGGGAPPATYTGVTPANAAGVLAMHQQRAQAPAVAQRQR